MSLVTSNGAFAERLRNGLIGSRGISLRLAAPPDTQTSVHRLACDCASAVLIVDACLFEKGLVVPGFVDAEGPSKSIHLLLAFPAIDRGAVELSMRARAHGCIDFQVSIERLDRAIDAVQSGELWFPRWMVQSFYDLALATPRTSPPTVSEEARPRGEELTQREIEVMSLVRRGLTNKEIARELCISPSTVKKHVHGALCKLGLAHRRQVF